MSHGLLTLVMGVVGSLFASFGNCIAYRIPRGMNWISGRSVCPNCGRRLTVFELIPVLSCVVLRAHCAGCHFYFGWGNAISELTLAVVTAFVFNYHGCSIIGLLFALITCCIYCIIAVVVSVLKLQLNKRGS